MSFTVNFTNQMLLFPSSTAALVFNLILVIWILSEIVGVTIIPRIRRKGVKIESRDRISGSVIFASIFISIIISYYFAANSIAMLPGWTYYIGISLMILGILLRQWSIWVLGRFFSGVVGVQENQKVIDRGPYAYVRHPSYTGALMILVGIGLAVQSWGAAIMLIVLFAIAYGYRIYVEEKAMISQFGDEYIQYAKRTKRIIPFIV
ncbi:MAG: methyltransferase family protein [Methanobacterium sp.]